MAHSNLTFQEAKNQIKKNSDVDQVSVHQDVQEGITAAPLQVTTARTYGATCTTTATNKIPAAQQHAQTQTDPLDQTVADSDSEMREGGIVSAPPQRCGCHGEKTNSGLTEFLILAVRLILQTVQDKELAQKLSDDLNTKVVELLGFTGAQTTPIRSIVS